MTVGNRELDGPSDRQAKLRPAEQTEEAADVSDLRMGVATHPGHAAIHNPQLRQQRVRVRDYGFH